MKLPLLVHGGSLVDGVRMASNHMDGRADGKSGKRESGKGKLTPRAAITPALHNSNTPLRNFEP